MKDGPLLTYVLERLAAEKGEWPRVARETGVSKRTIEKIADRTIADPGIRKIERLAKYLRSQEIAKGSPQPNSELRA